MEDRYMSLKEAAVHLGRTYQTLYNMVKNGRLTAYRQAVQRGTFVKLSDVENLKVMRPV